MVQKIPDHYENGIPLEDFFAAYYECRKHKRLTVNATLFEFDYERLLVELWMEVNERRYTIGKSVRFAVTKPKLREVFAANFRDRIIHHIIMMRLEALFEQDFIDHNFNCRKEKGTRYGVNCLQQDIIECSENGTIDCYIGKFDLQGFFMSIVKETLWQMLRDYINERYIGDDKEILLYLVEMVVMSCPQHNCTIKGDPKLLELLPKEKSLATCGDDRGEPIGNLTSQCFANFYLHIFDLLMLDKFKWYGRYVDDFYVVARNKEDILNAIPWIRKYLKDNLGLTLHPKKIYVQYYKKGVKFVGSVVRYDRKYISNSSIANAYDKIRILNKDVRKEKVEEMMQSLNSYFGFCKHVNAHRIKLKLVDLIDPRWHRWLNYDKKKGKFVLDDELNLKRNANMLFDQHKGNEVFYPRPKDKIRKVRRRKRTRRVVLP